jgi:hypothetical protein
LKYYNPQVRLPRIPVLKEREIKAWLSENPYSPKRFEAALAGETEEEAAQPPTIPEAAVAGDPLLLCVDGPRPSGPTRRPSSSFAFFLLSSEPVSHRCSLIFRATVKAAQSGSPRPSSGGQNAGFRVERSLSRERFVLWASEIEEDRQRFP